VLRQTARVRIDGYPDTLTDRADLPADPAFWPLYLAWLGGAATGGTSAELTATLLDEEAWPVLTVPVRAGHRVHVVFANEPEDGSVDFVLAPADDRPPVLFAEVSGHFQGPGLCWAELAAVTAPDRFLLLLPTLGDTATPPAALDVVARALTAVGADPSWAADLVEPRLWSPADWTDAGGLRWCAGEHSPRTEPHAALFAEAF
jgi:hypothetical protein